MKITRARFITAATGLAVIAGVGYLFRPKPLVVETSTVARRALESTVEAEGRTRVRERYTVVAPVTGRLERMRHVEGSAVRGGDVVARIAPLPLDSETVRQAHARIDAANALALAATAQVRAANAELDQRRRELSRAQRLAEIGGVAPRVVEECELAQLQAEEAARAATERTRAAEADARQAKATLLAREAGTSTVVLVRSPAAGRVLRMPERSERIVAAGTPLLEIGDPASLEVIADVLSSDGSAIHPGDPVRLLEIGDAGERTASLVGRVREIEPAGFTKVSALGVEEQRVNVIIDVDSLPGTIGDGFRVDASIVIWSARDVLVVPRSSLVQVQGSSESGTGWSAFVARKGRIAVRTVRVGHFGGTSAEVLDGLSAGDEVVVFPSDRVKAGTRISTPKQ
jgi:HlyD family secretion protein